MGCGHPGRLFGQGGAFSGGHVPLGRDDEFVEKAQAERDVLYVWMYVCMYL